VPQEGYPQEAYPQDVPAPPGMDIPAPPGMDVPAPPGMEAAPPPDEAAYAQDPSAAQDWGDPAAMQQPSYPPEAGYAEQPQQVSQPPLAADPAAAPFDAPEVLAQAPTPAPEEAQPKKKRKIDLKARLSNVRAAGTMAGAAGAPTPAPGSDSAAFPPPPASGSVPPPKMMSGSGIAPPAALLAKARPAAEKESRPTAQQQTIKVEVGEEVLAERRKIRKRMALYGAIAAVVTALFGFFIGQTKAQGDAQRLAVAGAGTIAKNIEESGVVLSELSDVLREATDLLGQEKYPAELGEKLKATHVPFNSELLTGKKIGGLPGSVLQGLLAYAGDVDRLNKRKDKLRNLLGMAKKPFEEYVAEKKKPMVRFSVLFTPQRKGMMAELAPLKQPFEEEADWPDKTKVMRLQRGKAAEAEAERWKKGELSGQTPLYIPVDQKTVAGFTSKRLIFDLKKALADTKDLVDGRQSQIPSEQTDGLFKDGEQLMAELKKVAQAGR
jgi:hypothetical protein